MTTVVPAHVQGSAASVTPRLAPALVNGRRIFIECPAWCTEDHVAANQRNLEDVVHTGDNVDLLVPGAPALRLLADVHLCSEPFAPSPKERATVVVVDDDSDMYLLPPMEAEAFADHLEAQAKAIRELAMVARQGAAA